jgi:glucokinase
MYLCFDIGGTNIKACITDGEGNCNEKMSVRTPEEYSAIIDIICGISKQAESCKAFGIAVPGTCMPKEGRVLFCPNLTSLNGQNIKEDVENIAGKPVFIENDANMATLGEYYFVERNNIKNMIFLTLGTGLGGGAVVNGSLLTSDISLFEAGHINIDPEGPLCGCGKRGCLESYVSISGILRTYRTLSNDKKAYNVNDIYNRYKNGDKVAALTFEVFAGYLANGMSTLANILVPEKIKIGGGISEMSDAFMPHTLKVFSRSIYPAYKKRVTIESAALKNNAGLAGCAALTISNL